MASGFWNERVPSAPTSVHAPVWLRLEDLVVLTIVSACALEASSKLLGVGDPIVQSWLVIGWTAAAARRLLAWRHGQGSLHFDRLSQTLIVVGCTAPLFLMPLVNPSSGDGSMGGRLSSPFWLQAIGGLSILVSLVAPFCARHSRVLFDGTRRFAPSLPGVELGARATGFILLAASPQAIAAVCVTGLLRSWTESQGQTSPVPVASRSIDSTSSREASRPDGSLELLPA
jgi:hypothetical protein